VDRPAALIDVAAALGEPVREFKRRIGEGVCKATANARPRWIAEVDD
jgi:hypothetical protein